MIFDPYRDGVSIVLELTGPAEERDIRVAQELLDEWLAHYESDGELAYRGCGIRGDVGSTRLVLWADRVNQPGGSEGAIRLADEIGARAERKLPLVRFEVGDAALAAQDDLAERLGGPVLYVRPGGDLLGDLPDLREGETVEAIEFGKPPTPHRVTASPAGLTIERAGELHVYDEPGMLKEARLGTGVFSRPFLLLKLAGKRRSLQLDAEAAERLLRGLGRRLAVRWCVRSRVKWFIPIAILFLLTSLPMAADPEASLEAIPLDTVGLALGGGLLVVALLARIRPMAWLVLADGFWLVVLAGSGVYSFLFRDGHWAWLFLDAWLVVMALSGVKLYRLLAALPTAR